MPYLAGPTSNHLEMTLCWCIASSCRFSAELSSSRACRVTVMVVVMVKVMIIVMMTVMMITCTVFWNLSVICFLKSSAWAGSSALMSWYLSSRSDQSFITCMDRREANTLAQLSLDGFFSL